MNLTALLFSAALLLAAPLGASTLSTMTVFCRAATLFVVANSTGCDLTDPATGATASALGVASMSDLTQPALMMSGFTSVSLKATPLGGDAEANIAISESFYTSGPVRQGFLVFDIIDATGSNPFQFVTGRISVGNQQFGFGNGGAVPPPFTQFPFAEFPFTLGIESSFGMTVRGSAGEGCGCAFGPSLSAYGVANVNFHLLEADGVTPVMIEPVPEPSMFWPIAMALALGWLSLCNRPRAL